MEVTSQFQAPIAIAPEYSSPVSTEWGGGGGAQCRSEPYGKAKALALPEITHKTFGTLPVHMPTELSRLLIT
jgi:hypothetical protein